MNLYKRISRKSFFNKLGLFGSGSVITSYFASKGLTSKPSKVTSKLEMRFKKPTKIIQSDIIS
jgi:hypothetical protein